MIELNDLLEPELKARGLVATRGAYQGRKRIWDLAGSPNTEWVCDVHEDYVQVRTIKHWGVDGLTYWKTFRAVNPHFVEDVFEAIDRAIIIAKESK